MSGRIASPPPPNPPPNGSIGDAETILVGIFNEADRLRIGQVRSSDLVNAFISSPGVPESLDFETLKRLLDPKGDDAQICQKEFVELGMKWFDELQTNFHIQRKPRPLHRHLGVRLNQVVPLPPIPAADNSFTMEEEINEKEDEFIDVDNSELAVEIAQLKEALQRVSDEKTSLQTSYAKLEDAFNALELDKMGLLRELKSKDRALETAQSYQLKFQDLTEALMSGGGESSDLKQKLEDIQNHTKETVEENLWLRNEADKTQDILSTVRKNYSDALEASSNFQNEIVVLKLEQEKSLNEVKVLNVHLREAQEALSKTLNQNESLESEVMRLVLEVTSYQEKINEDNNAIANSFDLSHDFLDKSNLEQEQTAFQSQEFWANLNSEFDFDKRARRHILKDPTSMSTPRVKITKPERHSIGDEIKKLNVLGSTPLCEKSTLHNSAADADNDKGEQVCENVFHDDESGRDQVEHVVKATFKGKDVPKFLLVSLMILMLLFTFLGGLEMDTFTFYPITWRPGFGLPEPWIVLKYQVIRQPLVW